MFPRLLQRVRARSIGAALTVHAAFDARALRALAPAVLALSFAPFFIPVVAIELNEPLFGDTLVFQYTGWCIRHGMRLYRDVGMADGPFIHFLHAAVQPFVGLTDHGFRIADLTLHVTLSAAMGAMLAPRARLSPLARWTSGVAWAAIGVVVWLSWYLKTGWSDTTEREGFYALFGSTGMVALYVSASVSSRRAAAIVALAGGFLVTTQVFGKPTGIVYPVFGALSLLIAERTSIATRALRVRMALAGAAACVLLVVVLLLLWGSIPGYFFWCFVIPYRGNRFLYTGDWLGLLFSVWIPYRVLAFSSLITGIAAIAGGFLPLRAVGFVLLPVVLYLGACLQMRGFSYQVMPLLGAANALFLVLLSNFWDSAKRPGPSGRAVGALALAFAGYYGFSDIEASPYHWPPGREKWGKSTHTFANEERQVGLFLKAHTLPTDTVFTYVPGEVQAILLTAERRTASPYFHAFWLDPVGLLPKSLFQPTEKELAGLVELQTKTRSEACGALQAKPPRAMTFSSLDQITRVCPNVVEMLKRDYDDAATINSFHVYLRKRDR